MNKQWSSNVVMRYKGVKEEEVVLMVKEREGGVRSTLSGGTIEE